jgi:hypothetical protein
MRKIANTAEDKLVSVRWKIPSKVLAGLRAYYIVHGLDAERFEYFLARVIRDATPEAFRK